MAQVGLGSTDKWHLLTQLTEITSRRHNWPMMNLAFWMAARVVSTLGPSVQKPWISGGLTWISATSRFNILRRNNSGTSLRKMGVKSARPSLTGTRQLAPMNREFDLNIPAQWAYQHLHHTQNSTNMSYTEGHHWCTRTIMAGGGSSWCQKWLMWVTLSNSRQSESKSDGVKVQHINQWTKHNILIVRQSSWKKH